MLISDKQFQEIMTATDPIQSVLRCVCFDVPGIPVPKGRPKFARRNGFVSAYTPKKTADYEAHVKQTAIDAMKADSRLCAGPVSVAMIIRVPVPTSWSKKRQAAAGNGSIAPTKKPDCDNVAKAVLDAMNGLVFFDDSQVVEMHLRKEYGEPMVRVMVRELPMESA